MAVVTVETKECFICEEGGKIDLASRQFEAYLAWQAGAGHIQDLLSELSDGEREQLMTGTHNSCFDTLL